MYVNMPINVISKACAMCPRLKIRILDENDGRKIRERDMECAYFDDCMLAVEMKQQGAENTATIEREGGGSSWWSVCSECHGAVDDGDKFCRHCGTPLS